MTLVITSCTNRKRKPIPRALHISDVDTAPLQAVAADWSRRLLAETERFPASAVYGGRAFQEAVGTARTLDARLLVISAGLGLIEAGNSVPPYACTVLVGAGDSVADRVTGDFSVRSWWAELCAVSPFASPLIGRIGDDRGPIFAALSDAYLAMIADELIALPEPMLERVRLFTRTPVARIAAELRPHVMPYDDRLDGPDSSVRGTRSDFAARAMRHFAGLGCKGSMSDDAAAVNAALSGWRMPPKVDRVRQSDGDLLGLMRTHWNAVGGSSSRLLRHFRDELGIACEQARFAALARQVREERL